MNMLKRFFSPVSTVCRYSITSRKMITSNGWPQKSIKCLPEVSFYYQNEGKNNKPVKRGFSRIYLSKRSSLYHWNIRSIRKIRISFDFLGLFKLQLYKCACSWQSRVFKNWKHSLSTAHNFPPFLIRQTVMAQTPYWNISLKSFPTSHIPPHWIWERGNAPAPSSQERHCWPHTDEVGKMCWQGPALHEVE